MSPSIRDEYPTPNPRKRGYPLSESFLTFARAIAHQIAKPET
jgi:hypothetical protein